VRLEQLSRANEKWSWRISQNRDGPTYSLSRIGTPDDVGAAVPFPVSDEASFISGQNVGSDGGLFAQPPWPDSDYKF